MNTERTSAIEFPVTHFPIKVMGENNPEFINSVIEALKSHSIHMDAEKLITKDSSKGRFLGVTIHVNANNQEELDQIYRTLTALPLTKMVL